MVTKGSTVVVVKGKKVPLGTTGVAFWVGETKYGMRVGLNAAGVTHWTAMGNVEVVGAGVAAMLPAPVAAAVLPFETAAPAAPLPFSPVAVPGLHLSTERIVALEARVAALEALLAKVEALPLAA